MLCPKWRVDVLSERAGGILLAVMIVDFARREAVVVRTMAG